ncbi:hypothetical protein GALMADRAFT_77195 [Galerina marginata CBS 339.88]|uniref:Uncharacterized protein n=1 Tax=Galerina marginata (strain CBS 339.88) TaxID=685588 RepID=A0A067SIG9_GALM3|nr:hypothetical protein GALMADRAFT_77195 [Galerina marginata CBS 339.88]
MPLSAPTRAPYRGTTRKLVLAFDIGTTFSGISYSVLDPGQVPEIKGVTRYPLQGNVRGASKVPTVVYYDPNGKVCAAGAEATRDGIELDAQEGKWFEAKWFKLHLRSDATSGNDTTYEIPPLPPNKTVVQVIADFLKYLFNSASQYIQETHLNGPVLWASVEHKIDFVLSHPNGWGGKEQKDMRRAAVLAGLIADDAGGHARISFVTEGEASLHFAIQAGILSQARKGEGVVIVDAGGGTIDVSAYRQDPDKQGQVFEEVAASQCLLHGSIFVNINAKKILNEFLKDSPYVEDVEHIIRCFDQTTKLRFRDDRSPQYIKFGSTRDNDDKFNIRLGQLKLEGTDVAGFFRDSVTAVLQSVLTQRSTSRNKIVHVVFVGGFAASDWLFNSASTVLMRTDPSLKVFRPEEQANKAVADGAISFYLDHFVQTRMSKFTCGVICRVPYDEKDSEHQKRVATKHTCPLTGETRLPDMFSVILSKNTQVSETKEFRARYYQVSANRSDFQIFSSSVWCYRGSLEQPKWRDQDKSNFSRLCSIAVDLSHLEFSPKTGRTGKTYYQIDYEVILLFGLTELKAQIAWQEDVGRFHLCII